MSSETKTLKASCLCGSANHEVTLKASDLPTKGYMCHCDSCRRMTGTLCLTVIFLPPYYAPAESVLSQLTRFVFSKRITQYFCTTCGCHMMARVLKDGDDPASEVNWDIATGTLSHIEGVIDWVVHEQIHDTLDGGFADLLPSVSGKPLERWPYSPNQHAQLPFPWTSPDRRNPTSSTTATIDKLPAQCKCGSIKFYISRPSHRSAFVEKYWPSPPPEESELSALPLPPEDQTFYLRDRGTKYLAGLCACNSCRLASGMEITTWAFVSTIDISLDAQGTIPWAEDFGTLKKYGSSPGCWRYFCGTCGAIVFYDADDRRWLKDVAMGLIVAPEGARAESWFGWRTSRLGYRDDAIPRAESLALGVEKGLREWEERRVGDDLSGGSRSGGAL